MTEIEVILALEITNEDKGYTENFVDFPPDNVSPSNYLGIEGGYHMILADTGYIKSY